MKRSILLVVVLLLIAFSEATVLAETSPAMNSVTTWRGNRSGALSLTFDDGYLTQYSFALPALNARGLRGTFFITTDWADWNWWREAANAGHEIGSHTITHPYLTTLSTSEAEHEIAVSKQIIEGEIPNQKCVSFSYSYGALNPTVEALVQKHFIGARGGVYGLNDASTDLYNAFAYDVPYITVSDMEYFTDQAASQGKWVIPLFHSFDPTQYGTWTKEMFLTYLDSIKGRTDLWIAPFGEVIRYMRERSTATLSVSSQTSATITLNLTDSLDNTLFNSPLTLKSVVPVNWASVKVQQGTKAAVVTPIVDGGQWVVYYDAVPDGGTITLTQGFSNSPPVATNDAYSAVVNTRLNATAPGVLGNDSNPAGATLTAQGVSKPLHGALTLRANGSFSYVPNLNYVGSDSFTYTANNGASSSDAATVTITVSPALSALSLKPSSVVGGATSLGTVTLSAPAPSGGTVVSLSIKSAAASVPASVPASVTVPSGSTSATFTITTTSVAKSTSVSIFAVYGTDKRKAALLVKGSRSVKDSAIVSALSPFAASWPSPISLQLAGWGLRDLY